MMIWKSALVGLVVVAFQIVGTMATEPFSMSKSTNLFFSDLHKVIVNKQNTNIVMSPISLWMTLSMTSHGAAGKTLKEFESGLHFSSNQPKLSSNQKSFYERLNGNNKSQLIMVNKVFIDKKFVVKDSFKNATEFIYKSIAGQVEFSNREDASNIINNWVSHQTASKIKDIVNPEDFNANTALVLVNTIYFQGKWFYKFFTERTENESFQLQNGTKKIVNMMSTNGNFQHGYLNEISSTFIVLPFESDKDNSIDMIVLLPDSHMKMSEVEQNLRKFNVSKCLSDEYYQDVNVRIPKFKLETQTDFKPILESLGMTDMFKDDANFTRIADQALGVDKIVQKVVIDINESGCSAAGATALGMSGRKLYEPFTLDRPFLFFITFRKVVLFSGRIVDPIY